MAVIDFHIHPVQVRELHDRDPALDRSVREIFGLFMKPQPLATLLLHLDAAGVDQAVMLPVDTRGAHGGTVVSNQQIAWLMEQSDRLIGFASVDPNLPDAAETLERDVKQYGLRGLKLDPALQQFAINDRFRAYPVYQAASELGIPLLIHCGMSWAPQGKASLAQPLLLEEVIHDFPSLPIVIAHAGWPWVNEALMLAIKHRHIHLDTAVLFSGTPSYSVNRVFGEQVGRDVIERSLSRQIVFGSNYPRVDPKRVMWAVKELGLRERAERRVLGENAAALLGMTGAPACGQ